MDVGVEVCEDSLGGDLCGDPAVIVFFFQNASFHPKVLQRVNIAALRRCCQALEGVWCVLNALHRNGFKASELVE